MVCVCHDIMMQNPSGAILFDGTYSMLIDGTQTCASPVTLSIAFGLYMTIDPSTQEIYMLCGDHTLAFQVDDNYQVTARTVHSLPCIPGGMKFHLFTRTLYQLCWSNGDFAYLVTLNSYSQVNDTTQLLMQVDCILTPVGLELDQQAQLLYFTSV